MFIVKVYKGTQGQTETYRNILQAEDNKDFILFFLLQMM